VTGAELANKLALQRDEVLNITNAQSEVRIAKTHITAEWTIKDVVGHISYWEQVTLDHVRESFTQGRPRPMSPKDPEAHINSREAKRRKGWKWSRVRAEYEKTCTALIERVKGLGEMELGYIVPNPCWSHQNEFFSIAQMIEFEAIAHGAEHIVQIKQGVAAPER
jgi:hypothetical protein